LLHEQLPLPEAQRLVQLGLMALERSEEALMAEEVETLANVPQLQAAISIAIRRSFTRAILAARD